MARISAATETSVTSGNLSPPCDGPVRPHCGAHPRSASPPAIASGTMLDASSSLTQAAVEPGTAARVRPRAPLAPVHVDDRPDAHAAGDRVPTASGSRTADGDELIDAMSSWWCAIHGYRHPVLDEALRTQADVDGARDVRRPHPRPAIDLGCAPGRIAPAGPLQHVFFADSGSVSVEVALKMAVQYQRGRGRPGKHPDAGAARRLPRRHGRGDERVRPGVGMHSMFADVLARAGVRPPTAGRCSTPTSPTGPPRPRRSSTCTPTELAAIICEPVLQGAGGMHVYNPDCLRRTSRGSPTSTASC